MRRAGPVWESSLPAFHTGFQLSALTFPDPGERLVPALFVSPFLPKPRAGATSGAWKHTWKLSLGPSVVSMVPLLFASLLLPGWFSPVGLGVLPVGGLVTFGLPLFIFVGAPTPTLGALVDRRVVLVCSRSTTAISERCSTTVTFLPPVLRHPFVRRPFQPFVGARKWSSIRGKWAPSVSGCGLSAGSLHHHLLVPNSCLVLIAPTAENGPFNPKQMRKWFPVLLRT